MDEVERLFKEDVREKKIVAQSAKRKKSHSGCNLPSDFMSRKEVRQMNGEVTTINIRKPMSYKQFKMLSKDLQEEYLKFLHDEFGCNMNDLSKAFKLSARSSLGRYFSTAGVGHPFPERPKRNTLDTDRWEKFWAGEDWVKPENASKMTNTDSLEETYEEKHDRVMGLLKSETITVDEAAEMLWIKFKPYAGWDVDKLCQEKLEDARQQVAELEDKLGQVTALQERTVSAANVVCFQFELRDVRDMEEVAKYLRVVNWPKKNRIMVVIEERNDFDAVPMGVCGEPEEE